MGLSNLFDTKSVSQLYKVLYAIFVLIIHIFTLYMVITNVKSHEIIYIFQVSTAF